jgi:hypothetical protein
LAVHRSQRSRPALATVVHPVAPHCSQSFSGQISARLHKLSALTRLPRSKAVVALDRVGEGPPCIGHQLLAGSAKRETHPPKECARKVREPREPGKARQVHKQGGKSTNAKSPASRGHAGQESATVGGCVDGGGGFGEGAGAEELGHQVIASSHRCVLGRVRR